MSQSSLLQRMSLTQTQVNGVWSLLIHLYAAFCKYTSSINHYRHLILVSKLCLLIVNDSVKPRGEFTLTTILLQLQRLLFSKRVADLEKSCQFYFMQMSSGATLQLPNESTDCDLLPDEQGLKVTYNAPLTRRNISLWCLQTVSV